MTCSSKKIIGFFPAFFLSAFFLCVFFASCASTPIKKDVSITDTSNLSYSRLEEANNNMIAGKYERAAKLLTSAYNLALSVDNTELLCKVVFSGIVYKSAVPNDDIGIAESFLNETRNEMLVEARKLAARSSDSDRKLLDGMCSVYEIRVKLDNEKSASGGNISEQKALEYASILDKVLPDVIKDQYYTAYLYRTKGDVLLLSKKYADAEKNFLEAVRLHSAENSIYEIGLDWYCLARCFSLAGKKIEAVSAIKNAIKYDRNAENTAGLASDYLAYSKIIIKGNPSEQEIFLSQELAAWAEKIARAGNISADTEK